MHPLSTALFILGYALALPIAGKMSTVVERQNRLAIFGHQAGIMLAALGWILRGAVFVAVGHVLWLVVAYSWFAHLGPSSKVNSKVNSSVTALRNSRTGRWFRRGDSNG